VIVSKVVLTVQLSVMIIMHVPMIVVIQTVDAFTLQ
jgi:hypothetical protein